MNSQYEIIQAQYKMANVLNSDKLENKEKYLKQLLQDQIDRNKRYVVNQMVILVILTPPVVNSQHES